MENSTELIKVIINDLQGGSNDEHGSKFETVVIGENEYTKFKAIEYLLDNIHESWYYSFTCCENCLNIWK